MNKKAPGFLVGIAMFAVFSVSAVEMPVSADGEVSDSVGAERATDGRCDNNSLHTQLGDQLHVKEAVLESSTAAHCYRFTALRGQSVILAISKSITGQRTWEIEYLEDGGWKKLISPLKVFSQLMPGTTVDVRVLQKEGMPFIQHPYVIVFGSYPVLRSFELRDQYGVQRIPSGYTHPYLLTQGYTQAYVEAYFTDTVGAPLKGASGRFDLDLKNSRIPLITEYGMSDENGRLSKVISFDRCFGGVETQEIEYFYGEGIWRSYYYVGFYKFENVYRGPFAQEGGVSDSLIFGHICKHRKVRR